MSYDGSGAFQLVVSFVQGRSAADPVSNGWQMSGGPASAGVARATNGGGENERFDVGAIEHWSLLWQPSLAGVTDRLEESCARQRLQMAIVTVGVTVSMARHRQKAEGRRQKAESAILAR